MLDFKQVAEDVLDRVGLEEGDMLLPEYYKDLLKEIEAAIVKGYTAGMNDARKGFTGSE